MKILRRAAVFAGAVVLVAAAAWIWGPRLTPLPAALAEPTPPPALILDRHGIPLSHQLDPEQQVRRHSPLAAADVPPHLAAALIAAEDRRFFRHDGFDVLATGRALAQLVRHRRVVSGGSTITQQVVKMRLHRGQPRSPGTKFREVWLARALEARFEKQEILAQYLDFADFGGIHRGARQASLAWFGRPLEDLSAAACATLAALPQSPARLDPRRSPDALRQRRDLILRAMAEAGDLDAEALARALAEPLPEARPEAPFAAPHAVAHLLALRPEPSEFPLRTTIDLAIQDEAERILNLHLARLERHHVGQGAIHVIENETGAIRAWVGSRDFHGPNGQVDHSARPRSPGSALKPFTYAAAFETTYGPWSLVADVPTALPTPSGPFEPRNFDRNFRGPVSARRALGSSLNVPAVRLLADTGGAATLVDILCRAGVDVPDGAAQRHGIGITLGNSEVTLAELTAAYSTLARLGVRRDPVILCSGKGETGTSSGEGSDTRHAIDPAAAWLVGDILRDNEARTETFGPLSSLLLPFPCAVKTGTSTDFRDNWALGYTGSYTVGVWLGNSDNSPMRGVTGSDGAARILHEIMVFLHRGETVEEPPSPGTVIQVTVDAVTGSLAAENHPRARREWAAYHAPPPEARHDPRTANPAAPILLPPEFAPWIESQWNPHPGRYALVSTGEAPGNPRILFPPAEATLILDPALPHGGRHLRLSAHPPDGWTWRSPSLAIEDNLALLTPGEHIIQGTHQPSGVTLETSITVRSR